MSESVLQFSSDTELSLFLWRHFADSYESRTLVLMRNKIHVEKVEKIVNQSSSWRFDETSFSSCFDSLSEDKISSIRTSLEHVDIKVGGERENCWLEEKLGLKVVSVPQEECEKDLEECLDMLMCLLSAACDVMDVWSATRLLMNLKPQVLPALRRRSALGGLNMLQTLFSYIMEATIENGSGTDSVLAEHIDFLKMFDRAVDQLHDEMISVSDVRLALQTSVQTAANFLLSTPKYPCNSKVRVAQRFVQKQIAQIVRNYNLINKIAPNKDQKAPDFLTCREKVCRHVIDRFTIMDLTGTSSSGLSPMFKTPVVQSTAFQNDKDEYTPSSETPKSENQQKRKVASFLNNNTPTPVRTSLFNESSDSGYNDSYFIDEKENIDPSNEVVVVSPLKPLKSSTPQRPKPKGLKIRPEPKNNQQRAVTKRNATSTSLKTVKRAKVSNQKSILSFFK